MDNRLLLARQSSGKDTRYTYAVGRLRVLETRLLTGSFFDKMAEAATYEESLKMLSENPEYRQDVENLKEKSNFESIFISQLKRLYNLVSELTEDKEITNIFLLKYDIDNLKTLIKIKLLGGTKEAGFVDLGIFKIETLRDYIKNNNFKLPGEKIGDFIAKISEVRKPQRIEFLFDEFYL
ncbi:MAG: hypothetical protein FJZ16_02000, partial [Candidatus Omnitrophica bacterium]|nr:hypothetical protein [Candidatus Omnitrophota bacterium]